MYTWCVNFLYKDLHSQLTLEYNNEGFGESVAFVNGTGWRVWAFEEKT